MTRILSEGFEMQDLVGYTNSGSAINTSVKRSGAASLLQGKANTLNYATPDLAEAYIRVAVNVASYSGTVPYFQMQWRHGTTVLGGLAVRPDLSASYLLVSTSNVVSGIVPIATGSWYMIEVYVKIDDAAGVLSLKVEGIADGTYNGDTKPGADAHFDNLQFFSGVAGVGSNVSVYIDDIGLNDTAGGVDDSWLGDGRIIVIKPDGDTATLELTPSAAVAHNTLVDDIPADGDSTYVEGSVDDEEDIYDLAACGLVDVIITRIWTEARARDTGASGKSVALITKASGGAEVSGGDVVLSSAYNTKVLGTEELVNPVDAGAWEVADIDALQGGPRTRP